MLVLNRFYSIEYLRCFLMLLIFLEHYPNSPIKIGGFAVCFFFVLSGFILSYGYYDRIISDAITYKKFILGRFLKIFILHWILLPIGFYLNRVTWAYSGKYILANFLLLQSWIPDYNSYYSGNGVSWFLSTLLFCYIIFPFLIKEYSFFSLKESICVCIWLLFIRVFLENIIPDEYRVDWLYISPFVRWIDFSMGILFYKFLTAVSKNSLSYSCDSIFLYWAGLFCSLLFCSILSDTCLYWFMFFILICVLFFCESHITKKIGTGFTYKVFSFGAKISFSFYLIHQIYILVIYNHFPFNSINEIWKFLIILSSCIIVSYISYFYIEHPIYKKLKSYLYN